LKASVYGLLFWFPKYVFEKGMAEYSGYIPSMIDVGTFIGGILLGYLGDRMGKRSLLLAPFIFFSCIMMLVTTLFLKSNPIPYFFVVLLIGVSLGGPYNIIGTTVVLCRLRCGH
jgi:sugar phosphate permease